MPTLRIVRNNEYNNRIRKFGLYLDGAMIGNISNGSEEKFDVKAGEHTLKAKVDWCGSEELSFRLQENETKTFYLRGYKNGSLFSKIALALFIVHLVLKYTMNFNYVIYLVVIAALYPLYFLTFGRNNYLRLSESFEV